VPGADDDVMDGALRFFDAFAKRISSSRFDDMTGKV
jgi:hypothetical protein